MSVFSTGIVPSDVRLSPDRHRAPAEGLCAMELASLLANEPFSDHPKTVCPVIASYVRTLNDNMPDLERHKLLPLLPRLLGTLNPDAAVRRREVLAMGAANLFAAEALRANGFRHYAAYLKRVEFADYLSEKLSRIAKCIFDLEIRTEPRSGLGLSWRGRAPGKTRAPLCIQQ